MSKYIDAEAFKEWIEDWLCFKERIENWFHKHNENTNTIPITELYDLLEQMPAADVAEVRHGRWVVFDSDEPRYDDIKCSVCRKHFTVDAERLCDIGFVIDDLSYCPNCGASMVDEVTE